MNHRHRIASSVVDEITRVVVWYLRNACGRWKGPGVVHSSPTRRASGILQSIRPDWWRGRARGEASTDVVLGRREAHAPLRSLRQRAPL